MANLYEYYNTGDDGGRVTWSGVGDTAQTFTPQVSHRITSVKLKLYRVGSPGTLTVGIRATAGGQPTGGDLVSGTTNGNTLPTASPYEWREITLGAGYNLVAGTQYAIVLQVGGDASNYVVWRWDKTSPTYAGGFLCAGSGESWTQYPDYDMMFEDWGEVIAITYYFNARGASGWTNPDNMIDGSTATFASCLADSITATLTGNQGNGSNLGTITKVEMRAHGYGDADDKITLTPVFGGTTSGTKKTEALGTSAKWSAYFDITTDTGAPSPWTWNDVRDLDMTVGGEKAAKANTCYCSRVEILVTYLPVALGPANVGKVDAVAAANIGKVDGVSWSSLSKVDGVA